MALLFRETADGRPRAAKHAPRALASVTLAFMSEPYRERPDRDPEVEKLAARGHAMRKAHDATRRDEARAESNAHLEAALGAYLGSSPSGVTLVFAGAGFAAILLAVLVQSWARPFGVVGAVVLFVSMLARSLSTPKPSAEEMAAERAWVAGLPFVLAGYWETVSEAPVAERTIVYEIVWAEGTTAPPTELLEGVIAAADPGARVESVDTAGAKIRSAPISADTGARVNRKPVLRNDKICAHVHAVADKALAPLHERHPLASVAVRG